MMKRVFTLWVCCLLAAVAAGQDLIPEEGSNGMSGFVDEQSRTVIPFQYDDAGFFSDGLAAVKLNGKWGFIDKQGNTVIPFKYDNAGPFSKGLAEVELDGKWGFIDKQGNTVIPFKYDNVWSFREGLAVVELNGKWGFIDKQGNTVIPIQYDDAGFFSDGLAQVKLKEKYGYIDKQGNTVILFKYDNAGPFSKGLARVRLNGIAGYINIRGKWFHTRAEGRKWLANEPFSVYAKGYVEQRVNEWQKKGEFEKTADWRARVNEQTRNAKIAALTREAEQQYIKERAGTLSYTLDRYDADNEVYLITCNDKKLLVPVPIADAPAFKQQWERITATPKYFIENDRLTVAEVTFSLPGGKSYRYSNSASLVYTQADIAYNFDPIEIDLPAAGSRPAGRQTVGTVNLQAGKSDVDTDIPQGKTSADRTFAVIIANENYTRLAPVTYALADGKTFGEYCRRTLGLPDTHVRYYGDATYGTMLLAMKDIEDIAAAYDGEIEVIFYYAGHGAPDETTQEAYLMPVDAYGVGGEASYPLARLYKELGSLGAERVTVFLDACFSGSTRDGQMLASARGVAIKPRATAPTGNMVVFTAAQGDEMALPYREKGHGLFTYYLLKKLKESRGQVTCGELGEYLTEQVRRRSQVVNRKSQTPAVLVSPALSGSWQTAPILSR